MLGTPNFDILVWWKENGPKYPILSSIARDILAIPVSTVTSESIFSTGGKVVSPHRNKLHSDTLEALMCDQNWLWVDIKGDYIKILFLYHICLIVFNVYFLFL